MTQFTVYGIPGSPYVRAVQISIARSRFRREQQSTAPRASPLRSNACIRARRLPQAILRYLDDVIPEPTFEPADARLAARMNHELERLLGSQPFMAGEQLSIADLMLAPNLDNLAATPEGKSLLRGTRLETWLARMNTRPSTIGTRRREIPGSPG
jgi:glutathione S-transferase